MSQYLIDGSWSKTPQEQRRKSIHAAIDELIDEVDGIEGMQVIIYGKKGATGVNIGKYSKTVSKACAFAILEYEAYLKQKEK